MSVRIFIFVLSALAVAAAGGRATAEVSLITVYETPVGQEDAVIESWETARDFLSREPGYLSATLYRSMRPESRFTLIYVSRWESRAAFQAAAQRLGAARIVSEIPGLTTTRDLYSVIADDGSAPAGDGQ